MKTLAELQERREQVALRIKELGDGSGGDKAQLSDEERGEFDGLSGEMDSLDSTISFRRTVERAASSAINVSKAIDPDSGAQARMHREPKQESKLQPGFAFAQYVKYLGRAKGNIMHAAVMAEADFRKLPMYIDARVPRALKTAVEAGSVGGSASAGGWGMELVSPYGAMFADFAEWLRPQTIVGQFGTNGIPALQKVPFRRPLGGVSNAGSGFWVGEGKAKPLTKFGFTTDTLEPLKVAGMCAVTEELLEDSDPSTDERLRNLLRDALVETKDLAFIDPANGGIVGIKPPAITNGITPIPSSGTDADAVRADVRAAMAGFISANNRASSAVWIMSASSALALSMMTNALGQPEEFSRNLALTGGRFAGLPVIVSEYVPGDSSGHFVILVNASDIYYADNGAIAVKTSDQASLEMSDAPSHDSVTPTGSNALVSMFQTDSIAYRADQRTNWKRRRDEAVQIISDAGWGVAP